MGVLRRPPLAGLDRGGRALVGDVAVQAALGQHGAGLAAVVELSAAVLAGGRAPPAYAPDLNPVEVLWSSLKAWSWPTVAERSAMVGESSPTGAILDACAISHRNAASCAGRASS
jgi:transposase